MHDRIIPRLEFIKQQKKKIDNNVLLRVALTGSDTSFAKEFMLVEPSVFTDYLVDYKERTKRSRAERNKAKRLAAWKGQKGNVKNDENEDQFLFAQEETVCD